MSQRRFVSWGNLAVSAVLMLLVWALLVFVASRPALKALIDLTPQRINSVDRVTTELLSELRAEKAEIEFHLLAPPIRGKGASDLEDQWISIRRRLVDLTQQLLQTYQYLGAESVKVIRHDFDAVDQQALREAAERFDYKIQEGDVLGVAVRRAGREWRKRKLSIVSDLALIDVPNSGMPGPMGRQSIPVLKDFKGETALSSALKSLLVQGNPVCYVLKNGAAPGTDAFSGTGTGYDGLFQGMQQAGFELQTLNFRDTPVVPDDASLLLLLEPRLDLQPREAEAVFAYLKRGGRVVLNYCWQSPEPDQNPTGGKLAELLGFELGNRPVFHLIVDPTGKTAGRGLSGDPAVAKLQVQYGLHPAVRRLAEAGRVIEITSALEVAERRPAPVGQKREPFLGSGRGAWLAKIGSDGYPDYQAPQLQSSFGERVLAMSIEVEPPAPAEGTAPPSERRPGVALVFGGVFANNAGMRAGFGDLMLNVCNWLVDRSVLLDIKGSRYEAKQISLQPPQFARIFWFLIAGVPGTFLVLGAVVLWMRRRQ